MDFGFFVVLDLEQTDEPELPPTPPTPVDPVDPPAPPAPVDPVDPGDYTPSEPYVPSQPTVIPEITVPLAELPEAPVVEAPAEVIIPEEAVPLAEIPTPVTDNPKTGQSGQGWLLSLLLMAAGALGLECKRKKA